MPLHFRESGEIGFYRKISKKSSLKHNRKQTEGYRKKPKELHVVVSLIRLHYYITQLIGAQNCKRNQFAISGSSLLFCPPVFRWLIFFDADFLGLLNSI